METETTVHFSDAREMAAVDDEIVDLTVTSPPYPMIEMWDEVFTDLDPAVGDALDAGDGSEAFSLMHDALNEVWAEVARVTKPGGTVCINIGDATRKVDGAFQLYPNHAKIIEFFRNHGFRVLPAVLWRKPTNKASKFMGSGMLPPNAYVTLEHEYILIFTKGDDNRAFEPGSQERYESAYFWEERNTWFSDVWTDIRGTLQALDNDELRDRSAAYPFEIPYRLINMYSTYGDTVLDPFWGTGTTSLAAMACARNSVGYEIVEAFADEFESQIDQLPDMTRKVNNTRLEQHLTFLEEKQEDGKEFKYTSEPYGFPVSTKQEKQLTLRSITDITQNGTTFTVQHEPHTLPSDHDDMSITKQQSLDL